MAWARLSPLNASTIGAIGMTLYMLLRLLILVALLLAPSLAQAKGIEPDIMVDDGRDSPNRIREANLGGPFLLVIVVVMPLFWYFNRKED